MIIYSTGDSYWKVGTDSVVDTIDTAIYKEKLNKGDTLLIADGEVVDCPDVINAEGIIRDICDELYVENGEDIYSSVVGTRGDLQKELNDVINKWYNKHVGNRTIKMNKLLYKVKVMG